MTAPAESTATLDPEPITESKGSTFGDARPCMNALLPDGHALQSGPKDDARTAFVTASRLSLHDVVVEQLAADAIPRAFAPLAFWQTKFLVFKLPRISRARTKAPRQRVQHHVASQGIRAGLDEGGFVTLSTYQNDATTSAMSEASYDANGSHSLTTDMAGIARPTTAAPLQSELKDGSMPLLPSLREALPSPADDTVDGGLIDLSDTICPSNENAHWRQLDDDGIALDDEDLPRREGDGVPDSSVAAEMLADAAILIASLLAGVSRSETSPD